MKVFPPFRLDTLNQCLWRRTDTGQDERVSLSPKVFGVLRYLIENSGRLVTHHELLNALWPDTHVQPEVLKSHILEVRNALGDRAKNSTFVETLPRRGYRFIAQVRETLSAPPPVPPIPTQGVFVGRERPLRELHDSFRKALESQRQVVIVTGEAGIGKTALVDEFQRQVAVGALGMTARGQCVEGYGSKEAYYPVLEALGHLCKGSEGELVVQVLAKQAPTWLVQYPALLKREQRDMLEREIQGATHDRMLREIGEALETITSHVPLLLVLEDLQWVDASTVDLLSSLARRRGPAKLMLIGTYRSVDLVAADHPLKTVKQNLLVHQLCRELALEPLREADVAEYLAFEAAELAVPGGLAGLIYRHTEGNPLFMVATMDHMRDRGLIAIENATWQIKVPLETIDLEAPESLRQMIELQIERLSEEEQRVLEAASVAGVLFSTAVGAVVDMAVERFEDSCERLSRRHQMLRRSYPEPSADGIAPDRYECVQYEFLHALYREAFYRRQSPRRRAELHLHMGERLEALHAQRLSDVASELAHHFERARDWRRAIKYLQVAADTAGRRFAPQEAAAILHHALDLVMKLPDAERPDHEIKVLDMLAMIYIGWIHKISD